MRHSRRCLRGLGPRLGRPEPHLNLVQTRHRRQSRQIVLHARARPDAAKPVIDRRVNQQRLWPVVLADRQRDRGIRPAEGLQRLGQQSVLKITRNRQPQGPGHAVLPFGNERKKVIHRRNVLIEVAKQQVPRDRGPPGIRSKISTPDSSSKDRIERFSADDEIARIRPPCGSTPRAGSGGWRDRDADGACSLDPGVAFHAPYPAEL